MEQPNREQNALGYIQQVLVDYIGTLPQSSRVLVDRECGACLKILSEAIKPKPPETKPEE